MSVEERIRDYLVSELGLPDDITFDDPLIKRGLLVSAQLIEIVLFAEDEFGIVLRPVDVVPETMESIHSMARVIEERLGAAPGAKA